MKDLKAEPFKEIPGPLSEAEKKRLAEGYERRKLLYYFRKDQRSSTFPELWKKFPELQKPRDKFYVFRSTRDGNNKFYSVSDEEFVNIIIDSKNNIPVGTTEKTYWDAYLERFPKGKLSGEVKKAIAGYYKKHGHTGNRTLKWIAEKLDINEKTIRRNLKEPNHIISQKIKDDPSFPGKYIVESAFLRRSHKRT